jgi:spore germination protein GerM
LKKNKSVEIDFNSSLEKGGAGNIIINRIDQIVYTMTQFKDINSIIIKINGQRRNSIGADGLSISGPIHRRNIK